ncbi:hypothetical protein FWK35_00013888 [Aphis craccivora]|uniref:Uncharacterized protein n=1 Tax=Aphis craccivora TaxID=307492 RepID=A0A6G0YUB1_APHCR|nr:hypothetical protein FWK35_00013888 [Aphis craccivora]
MLIKKIVPMYSYNFLIIIGRTYEELFIKFSSIFIGQKKFYRHFKKKFSENLKISVVFIAQKNSKYFEN